MCCYSSGEMMSAPANRPTTCPTCKIPLIYACLGHLKKEDGRFVELNLPKCPNKGCMFPMNDVSSYDYHRDLLIERELPPVDTSAFVFQQNQPLPSPTDEESAIKYVIIDQESFAEEAHMSVDNVARMDFSSQSALFDTEIIASAPNFGKGICTLATQFCDSVVGDIGDFSISPVNDVNDNSTEPNEAVALRTKISKGRKFPGILNVADSKLPLKTKGIEPEAIKTPLTDASNSSDGQHNFSWVSGARKQREESPTPPQPERKRFARSNSVPATGTSSSSSDQPAASRRVSTASKDFTPNGRPSRANQRRYPASAPKTKARSSDDHSPLPQRRNDRRRSLTPRVARKADQKMEGRRWTRSQTRHMSDQLNVSNFLTVLGHDRLPERGEGPQRQRSRTRSKSAGRSNGR